MPKRRSLDISSDVLKEGDLNECHPNEDRLNEEGEPQEEIPLTPKKRSRKKKDATSVPLTQEEQEKVPLTSQAIAASLSLHAPICQTSSCMGGLIRCAGGEVPYGKPGASLHCSLTT
jgi:hypothetical protein